MTNRELLRTLPEKLSSVDRQRRSVLAVESTPRPCPACQVPLDAVTAAGLDLDAFTLGQTPPRVYHCPHCEAILDRITPVIAFGPGWHWQLNHHWIVERLSKAGLYDQEHPEDA